MENSKVKIVNINLNHYNTIKTVLDQLDLNIFTCYIDSTEFLFREREYTEDEISNYNMVSRMGFEYAVEKGIISKTVKEINKFFAEEYSREIFSIYSRFIDPSASYDKVFIFININTAFIEDIWKYIEQCAGKTLDNVLVNCPDIKINNIEKILK